MEIAIDKNLKWNYQDGKNRMEKTINLSKPKKNNKEVVKLLAASQAISLLRIMQRE